MTKTESTENIKLPSGIKPLEELTLMDDYMFGAVMRNKENLKPLLESILNTLLSHTCDSIGIFFITEN